MFVFSVWEKHSHCFHWFLQPNHTTTLLLQSKFNMPPARARPVSLRGTSHAMIHKVDWRISIIYTNSSTYVSYNIAYRNFIVKCFVGQIRTRVNHIIYMCFDFSTDEKSPPLKWIMVSSKNCVYMRASCSVIFISAIFWIIFCVIKPYIVVSLHIKRNVVIIVEIISDVLEINAISCWTLRT